MTKKNLSECISSIFEKTSINSQNQWKSRKTNEKQWIAKSVFSLISFDFHWFWLFMLVFSKMEDIHSFKIFLVTKKSVLKRYFFAHFRVAHFLYWMPKPLLFTLYETTYTGCRVARTRSRLAQITIKCLLICLLWTQIVPRAPLISQLEPGDPPGAAERSLITAMSI